MKMINNIEYLGTKHKFKTSFQMATKEEINLFKKQFNKCPSLDEVILEMKNIFSGKNVDRKIRKYFLFNIMCNVRRNISKWTINQSIKNDVIISYIIHKLKSKQKIFNGIDKNSIMTFFRIGGGSKFGVIPTIYKLKDAKDILLKYNKNNVYYDYSCGWGSRMLAAMQNNITYFGTDPNYELTTKLEEIHSLYDKVNNINTKIDIRTQGSEHFIPEWKNKIGVAFSSPPYFNCECYRIGDQSYIEGKTTYNDWKNNYLFKTIDNIYEYLIDDGYFIINTKNITAFDVYAKFKEKKFNIEDDVKSYAEQKGFQFIRYETLKVNLRQSFKNKNSSNENILVFKKVIRKNDEC